MSLCAEQEVAVEKKSHTDTMFHFIAYLLFGTLMITVTCGVLILPGLIDKTPTELTVHSTIRSIGYILTALWIAMIVALVLGIIAVRQVRDMRIAQQTLGISFIVLQRELEKAKSGQRQGQPQISREANVPQVTTLPDESGSFLQHA